MHLPGSKPAITRHNPSYKAVDSGNSDDNQTTPFYSREASRVVLNPGTSRGERDIEKLWEPVSSASRAAREWDEKLAPAMAYFSGIDIPWSVLHLGLLNRKITVAVIYEDGEATWDHDEVERGMRDLFFSKENFPDIVFIGAGVKKGARSGVSEYGNRQSCGASIGVQGVPWSAGTVGGYFESDTGELYGLTCHHVLLPTKQDPTSENGDKVKREYPEYLDTIGLHHSAFNPKDGAIEVVQPPCGDHEDTLEETRARIVSAERHLEALKVKYEARGGLVPEKLSATWLGLISDLSSHLTTVEAHDRAFGTLVASSGYKVDPNLGHSIDWALFKISSSRAVLNMIPAVDREVRRGSWSGLSKARTQFQGIADPVVDGNVFKIGRKTGTTFGIVSGTKDGVNLMENLGETREWCVVGKNGTKFSATGDSGSLVFNEKFQVVGLLTAGCDSAGRLTFMTPIRLVLQEILGSTGENLKFWDNM